MYDVRCMIYDVRLTMYDLRCTTYDVWFYDVRFTIYDGGLHAVVLCGTDCTSYIE